MRPCLLIPYYNHGATIGSVLEAIAARGLRMPGIVVDDGSDTADAHALDLAASRHSWVSIVRRASNGGKGAALKTGYRAAAGRGFTHALQLDADGQHDPAALPRLLEESVRHPEAVVLCVPKLRDAPAGRRYGRLISTFWVWIETGSRQVRDPLCGLRCMPLDPTLSVLDGAVCGDAMDFDPEIVVRLVWAGTPVRNVSAAVSYPPGGVSHFRMFRDNLLISWLHTRLVCGMLLRLPGWMLGRFASSS